MNFLQLRKDIPKLQYVPFKNKTVVPDYRWVYSFDFGKEILLKIRRIIIPQDIVWGILICNIFFEERIKNRIDFGIEFQNLSKKIIKFTGGVVVELKKDWGKKL